MRTFSSKLNTGMLHPMDIYQIRKHNLVKLIGSQRKAPAQSAGGWRLHTLARSFPTRP